MIKINDRLEMIEQLKQAGVRELRFVAKNVAVDQFGRKILFKRTIVKGEPRQTFVILPH